MLKDFRTALCTEIGKGRQKSNSRCSEHLWIYFLRLQVSLGELAGKCRCTFVIVLFVQTVTMADIILTCMYCGSMGLFCSVPFGNVNPSRAISTHESACMQVNCSREASYILQSAQIM